MRNPLVSILSLVAATIACTGVSIASDTATDPPYGDNVGAGRVVEVNGIDLYFETYGDGPVLLLIHGNGDSIKGMSHQISHFSTRYRVLVVDSRGHGKSGLGTAHLTYEQMAEDYNALLEQLGLQSVRVLGWSDGGIIGLLLAMQHPEKIGRLAIMGASLRPDGAYDWAPAGVKRGLAYVEERIAKSDPSKPWHAIKQQLLLCLEQPNIPTFALADVQVPTLVMAGDRDIIRDDHTLEIFHALPKAQLCIFPGATHGIPVEDPQRFNQVVDTFFEKPFQLPDSEDGFRAF